MNVYFSNVNFSSSSGPNSFACRLANELTLMGHRIVGRNELDDTQQITSMLIFIEPDVKINPAVRTVHRLDGIWFKPEEYHTHNKNIKYAYDNSNAIIWQSDFDRKMSERYWGKRSGCVINNGIKLENVINKDRSIAMLQEKYDKIFVCSASWHRQKRLKENFEVYKKLKISYPSSCLVILGSNPDYSQNIDDVYFVGNVSHQTCLELYSVASAFIHMAWLDHCPNVVVEALSQKCPVICTNSGGTAEVVKSNGLVIPESRDYNFELTNYDNPYDIIIPDNLTIPNVTFDIDHINIKNVAFKYAQILAGSQI